MDVYRSSCSHMYIDPEVEIQNFLNLFPLYIYMESGTLNIPRASMASYIASGISHVLLQLAGIAILTHLASSGC